MKSGLFYSLSRFSIFVILLTTGNVASGAERELCLQLTSTVLMITHDLTLSYTGLRDGHTLLYGDGCYTIPATSGGTASSDCTPLFGSGILHENKLEATIQGTETQADFGRDIFTSSQTHILLDITTLSGTWTAESLTLIADGDPNGHQQFDKGAVKAVPCPPVTDAAKQADKQFKEAIRRLDQQ